MFQVLQKLNRYHVIATSRNDYIQCLRMQRLLINPMKLSLLIHAINHSVLNDAREIEIGAQTYRRKSENACEENSKKM